MVLLEVAWACMKTVRGGVWHRIGVGGVRYCRVEGKCVKWCVVNSSVKYMVVSNVA